MRLRGSRPAALAFVCAVVVAVVWAAPSRPAPPSPWAPPRTTPARPDTVALHDHPQNPKIRGWVNDEPDTGQFLPDTVQLARVADRVIRVRDYVESYFSSYAEYRPRPDTAGRLEFLNSMINKDVLGLTALAINRPFGFEDRVTMREHSQRVYSNILYQRAILDSVTVSEEELKKIYPQHQWALHLRHILFTSRSDAEKVRRELVAGRITWKEAVLRHSVAPEEDRKRDGDLGFKTRFGFDPVIVQDVFSLESGQISQVLSDPHGYQLVQVVERNPVAAPSYNDLRSAIVSEVRGAKIAERSERLRTVMRSEIGMTYDTTNVDWAWRQFAPTISSGVQGGTTTLDINTILPEFTPADTGRVLARHRFGKLTLGGFIENYSATPPLMRASVNDFDAMRQQIDGIVLEPYMAEMAVRRGLDRDPMAVQQIEGRREQLLVEHLYADSITSRVWIQPQDRRKFYKENLPGFMTFPHVSFAAILRRSKAGADSVAARLRAGDKAEAILRADSLQGLNTGSVQDRSSNDHGAPYQKLLFEELRPGQVTIEGPDREGSYVVIQLRSFDAGRQLRYEEVEHLIDESLQNIKSEERLKAFLARARKRYPIETRPELLARVRMVDPSLDE